MSSEARSSSGASSPSRRAPVWVRFEVAERKLDRLKAQLEALDQVVFTLEEQTSLSDVLGLMRDERDKVAREIEELKSRITDLSARAEIERRRQSL